MASAALASDSAGVRAWSDPGRTHWSRLAVTAVIAEDKIKVWLRDYRLAEGELESLQRQLTEDLRKLGYGLALLVFNGQVRHTAEGHHGD